MFSTVIAQTGTSVRPSGPQEVFICQGQLGWRRAARTEADVKRWIAIDTIDLVLWGRWRALGVHIGGRYVNGATRSEYVVMSLWSGDAIWPEPD